MKYPFKKLMLTALACLSLSAAGFVYADDNTDNNTNNTPGQESVGQYASSSALTVKVKAKLMADDTVKALPISVITYKDVVLLAGFVDDAQQVKEAARVAKSVDGVRVVKNCLYVKSQFDK